MSLVVGTSQIFLISQLARDTAANQRHPSSKRDIAFPFKSIDSNDLKIAAIKLRDSWVKPQ